MALSVWWNPRPASLTLKCKVTRPVSLHMLTPAASSCTSSSFRASVVFSTFSIPSGLRRTSLRSARPPRAPSPAGHLARERLMPMWMGRPALLFRPLLPTTPSGFPPTTSTALRPRKSRAGLPRPVFRLEWSWKKGFIMTDDNWLSLRELACAVLLRMHLPSAASSLKYVH